MPTDSFAYTTVATARETVVQLYSRAQDDWFPCEVEAPVMREDDAMDATYVLYVKRLRDAPHAYQLANGTRIFRTAAKLEPTGLEFTIDVMVRLRNNAVSGADLYFSEKEFQLALDHDK